MTMETTPAGAAPEIAAPSSEMCPASGAVPPEGVAASIRKPPPPPPPLRPPDGARFDEGLRLGEFLYSGCRGYVAVTRNAGRMVTDVYAIDQLKCAITSAAAHANHFDVWLRTSTLAVPPRRGRRGSASETLHVPYLQLDVDGRWGNHAAADPARYPATIDDALSLLDGFPHPSAIVSSGGGVYPTWKLDIPLEGNAAAVPVLRRWHADWQERFAESGFHLDNTADSSRILRWPGTMNRKTDPPVAVELLELTGAVYSLHELVEELDRTEEAPTSKVADGPIRVFAPSDAEHPFDAVKTADGQRFVADELVERHGWTEVGSGPNGAIDLLRPSNDTHGPPSSSLSVRVGGVHPSSGDDMTGQVQVFSDAVERVPAGSYTVGGFLSAVMFDGDHRATAEYLVAHGWGDDIDVTCFDYMRRGPSTVVLPDSFWSARPVLGRIRQAGQNRYVPPDALLGACLARLAVLVDHRVRLPGIIGSPVGLSLLVSLSGPPEAGKSSAAAVATELLPMDLSPHERLRWDLLPIGSGEGMAEILFENVKVTGGDGKSHTERRQTKFGAIFYIDEGAVLTDLGLRNGSILMPTLRTIFTHGTLGSTNASPDKRRILRGDSYVFGITMGVQPELAGDLLGDAAAGTPQRFLWMSATDPNAPDEPPDWPGPIEWTHPEFANPWDLTLAVPEPVKREVREDRQAVLRGIKPKPTSEAHQVLVRLKVAALLALLDGRTGVTVDDWDLGRTVVDTSRSVRESIEAILATEAARREGESHQRAVRREVAVEHGVETSALESAASSVGRHVHKHGGCKKGCITRSVAGKHRSLLGIETIIERAEARGWISPTDDDRWLPGDSRPA